MSRGIKLVSGMITLPACSRSEFRKKFGTQNYNENDDGHTVWNRLNGMRYVWHLYFTGISQIDMNNIKNIYEASTLGTLEYYPDTSSLDIHYDVFIDNPYAFREAFRKGSGKWSGEIKLITEELIDENTYYSDHFLIDAANVAAFELKYPKWDLLFSPVSGTEVYTSDSYLCIVENRGISQDLRGYISDDFTLDFLDIYRKQYTGNYIYFKLCPYPEVTNPSILLDFGYNWPHPTDSYSLRILKNYVEVYSSQIGDWTQKNYDLRIKKNAETLTIYWRVSGEVLWTQAIETIYSPNWTAGFIRMDAGGLTAGDVLKLNQVLFTPDFARTI